MERSGTQSVVTHRETQVQRSTLERSRFSLHPEKSFVTLERFTRLIHMKYQMLRSRRLQNWSFGVKQKVCLGFLDIFSCFPQFLSWFLSTLALVCVWVCVFTIDFSLFQGSINVGIFYPSPCPVSHYACTQPNLPTPNLPTMWEETVLGISGELACFIWKQL